MKLLCFQAKRFRWQTYAKTLPDVPDQRIDQEVDEAVIVFIHAEAADAAPERASSVLRQSVKHIKWLANKRSMKNLVLHSFAHLGGAGAEPEFAGSFIEELARRLTAGGYQVATTPFGYFCEWDLSVYGDSLAKVWKEIH
jgi:hypothetical protein